MNDREYLLLKKILEKNRKYYKDNKIDFSEYIENHLIIMEKIKQSIIKIERCDYEFLASIDLEECLERYRKGVMIVKFNLN